MSNNSQLHLQSLSGVGIDNDLIEGIRFLYLKDGQVVQAEAPSVSAFITDQVNRRIDSLELSGNGPSIWPVARLLTLNGIITGTVSFDGSANATLNTSLADGAVSISKVAGLRSELDGQTHRLTTLEQDQHHHIYPITEVMGVDLSGELIPPTGFSLATYQPQPGGQKELVVSFTDPTGGSLQLFGDLEGERSVLTLRTRLNGSWSSPVELLHSGSYDFTEFSRKSGQIYSGNHRFIDGLRLSADTRVFYDGANSTAYLALGDGARFGLNTQGPIYQSVVNGEIHDVLHSGILDPDHVLRDGEAIAEVYGLEVPIYGPGATVNFNTVPPGRAILSRDLLGTPATTQSQWYVETLKLGSNQTHQRAYGTITGEFWIRQRVNGAWTDWRRQWDNINFVASNYLQIGAYGLGGQGTAVTNADLLKTSGFFEGDETPGAAGLQPLLHVEGSNKALQVFTTGTDLRYRLRAGMTWGATRTVFDNTNFNPALKVDYTHLNARGITANPTLATTDVAVRSQQGLSTHVLNLGTFQSPPSTAPESGQLLVMGIQNGTGGSAGALQLAGLVDSGETRLWGRVGRGSVEAPWVELLHSGNVGHSGEVYRRQDDLDSEFNLNDITSSGYYYQPLDHSASPALNYPVPRGGMLHVYYAANMTLWQEYHPSGSTQVWRRYSLLGGWSSWRTSLEQRLTSIADVSGTYATIPAVLAVSRSDAELPIADAGVLTLNAGQDRTSQLMLGQSGELGWRAFDSMTGWGETVRLWTDANLTPADYARLDGAVFTHHVEMPSLQLGDDVLVTTLSAGLEFNHSSGAQLRWDQGGLQVKKSLGESAAVLTTQDINPTSLLHRGDAVTEMMGTEVLHYESEMTFDALPFGRVSVAAHLPGSPDSSVDNFIVETYIGSSNSSYQRAMGNDGSVWMRHREGGVWDVWTRFYTTGDFDQADVFVRRGELGGVSLNSVLEPGTYHQANDAQATSGREYPVARAGLLVVYAVNSERVWQAYHPRGNTETWRRAQAGGIWSDWSLDAVQAYEAVDKAGDTMEGPLLAARHPESAMEMATRGFVESTVQQAAGDGLEHRAGKLHAKLGHGLKHDPTTNVIAIDELVVTRKVGATVGNGLVKSFDISHGLNTYDISVTVRRLESGEIEVAGLTVLDANTLRVVFKTIPPVNSYKVLILG